MAQTQSSMVELELERLIDLATQKIENSGEFWFECQRCGTKYDYMFEAKECEEDHKHWGALY